MRFESINCLFMFSATKLFICQRPKIVMLANEIRIQLNQQAHETQYTGSKLLFLHWFVHTKHTSNRSNVKFVTIRYQVTAEEFDSKKSHDLKKAAKKLQKESPKFSLIQLETFQGEIKGWSCNDKKLLSVLSHEYSSMLFIAWLNLCPSPSHGE